MTTHNANFPPPPGAAPHPIGGLQNSTPFNDQSRAQNQLANEGAALETTGAAQASEGHSTSNQYSNEPWPPPGDAVYTTDEARCYLYDRHDVLLKERHIQKLVSEQHKLVGKRVPKDGGGVVLEITRNSLDQYVHDHPEKQNAKDTPLDPKDKLFNQLRNIAGRKGYAIMIEGVAPAKAEAPTPAPQPLTHQTAPASAEKTAAQPTARVGESDAQASVSLETYTQLKNYTDRLEQRVATLEDTTTKLYDTLDSTYDKMTDIGMELMALTKQVTAKLESPSTILDSMTSTIKAANNIDDNRPLPAHIEHRDDHEPGGGY